MSEQGIDVTRPARWTNSCHSYDVPPLTRWQEFKFRFVPSWIRYSLHWAWFGHEFFPAAQWVKWKGPPPCCIARLWKRPPNAH